MSEDSNSADDLKTLPGKVRRLVKNKGILPLDTAEKMEPSAKEQKFKSSVVLTAIFTAILTTIVSQVVIEVFSLNEPNLVYIGERPETPMLDVKFGDRPQSEID